MSIFGRFFNSRLYEVEGFKNRGLAMAAIKRIAGHQDEAATIQERCFVLVGAVYDAVKSEEQITQAKFEVLPDDTKLGPIAESRLKELKSWIRGL